MATVHIGLALLAGFIAGYVMALMALWMEGLFGVPRLDFGQAGMKYLGGERAGWWVIGMASHLINSVIFTLFYAAALYPHFSAVGLVPGDLLSGIGGGVAYGLALWIGFAMLLVMPMMGSGVFGVKSGSLKPAFASLIIHLVYGAVLGGIYRPEALELTGSPGLVDKPAEPRPRSIQ